MDTGKILIRVLLGLNRTKSGYLYFVRLLIHDHKLLHGRKFYLFFDISVVLINRHKSALDPLLSYLEFIVGNLYNFGVIRKTSRGQDVITIEKIRYLNKVETLFIKGLINRRRLSWSSGSLLR